MNNFLLGATRDYQYFFVVESPPAKGRTTSTYGVVNRRSGRSIGTIRWHGAWRQFCFFPHNDTVWSAGCLADLQDAIKWADGRRRGGRR